MNEENTIALLGAVNLGASATSSIFSKALASLGPILHDLLTAAQVVVAVVTVLYVWRKAQNLKHSRKPRRKTKKN